MKTGFFITGTDTDVGKTFVTCRILHALRKRGVNACGYKPLLCGERTDAVALFNASSPHADVTIDDVNPVWLRPPAAPYTASVIEERVIDLDAVFERFDKLRGIYDCVLVEGAGGWRVPVRSDYFVSDLAEQFALPVILVTRPNLGTLNHTLLTVESIRARGKLPLAGLVINQSSPEVDMISAHTNPPMLEELSKLPILARIAHGETEPNLSKLLDACLG
ncbi:dethiobiotin synthase [Kamptonema cortianum]|uniref:ATP-dependent dethiobiotin synthetase BioD n=1 Tax=Geitlerinema calcuttense NRMC-F 0142 TaxID=2922238 RepID=A0ABT7LX87_9CYAN|nr:MULTISPECIES: dethiobiotin synthase [Cyanophyceae]MDK3156664.1 dethiobiotin synthase [Kamptonema cortianum]MDL5050328.1 dethiobiotin synthase [Oscillatoria amoena NRMC-F 0135]MDL5053401.1 dethiobiotin synthase [Oscillatoria laete-virens NRMC-F 0139]MDL5056619.1 dethiobiotin synthase [Geitlerinema calcuttense NRMC-F 0142]